MIIIFYKFCILRDLLYMDSDLYFFFCYFCYCCSSYLVCFFCRHYQKAICANSELLVWAEKEMLPLRLSEEWHHTLWGYLNCLPILNVTFRNERRLYPQLIWIYLKERCSFLVKICAQRCYLWARSPMKIACFKTLSFYNQLTYLFC